MEYLPLYVYTSKYMDGMILFSLNGYWETDYGEKMVENVEDDNGQRRTTTVAYLYYKCIRF